jgi:alginate O-acetyltransferase complex protein AlgJ
MGSRTGLSSNWFHKVLAVIFFLFVLTPVARMLTFGEKDMGTEKRVLSPPPIFSGWDPDDLNKFSKDFESYFNDHFGFRHSLIRLNSILHVELLGMSPTDKVVLGKEDWLFYNSADDGISLPDYEGQAPFQPEELKMIDDNLIRMKNECLRRRIDLLVVIAPSKHTIYSEYLPSRYRPGIRTRLDQIVDTNRSSAKAPLLDLRAALRQAKTEETYPLYYHLDTHWNALGAFKAAVDIMKRLQIHHPNLKIPNLSNFDVMERDGVMQGDLAGFVNLQGFMIDQLVTLQFRSQFTAKPLATDYPGHPEVIANGFQGADDKAPRLLMFHDSFGPAMFYFLAESFSKSEFYRTSHFDCAQIDRAHPDIVIMQLTERYLHVLRSASVLFPE